MKKLIAVISVITLSLGMTSCGSGNSESSKKAEPSAFEQEQIKRFTEGYCEFVNDLTVASGFFYTVMNSGMSFRRGDLYAGSWVHRIGEMLKINKLESTPEGTWIAGYAAYFENLDTKFKESDIRPTKEELGKLGALVQTLQSQSSGFAKWDACSSSYEPSTEDLEALLEANEKYKDFIANPKK
jgi:hypothetical protein